MAYSNFKLKDIERLAHLNEVVASLFKDAQPLMPSNWLKETLEKSSHLFPKSEKSRSELLIMPLLLRFFIIIIIHSRFSQEKILMLTLKKA